MHLHCELSISELTPAGGPIGLEKAAAGSNGGAEGRFPPWRRRKLGGGGEKGEEEAKRRWSGRGLQEISEVQGTTDRKVQLRQQHQDYKNRKSERELHCCNLVICCVPRLGKGNRNPG